MNNIRAILRANRPRTGMAAAFAAIAAGAASATVTVSVSNVAFTQDAASHDVKVTYDLVTSDGEPAFVSLDVLTNGVSVGATRVKSVIGDVSTTPADTASLVEPGTGKSIVWKARADLPNVGLTDAAVRVTDLATNHFEGLYMVVDLSRGKDSTYWPVQYTACKPDINSPAFYTTELWLRRVPAGTFAMGYDNGDTRADSCEPVHNVTLSRDFYCGVVPVTRAQYVYLRNEYPNGKDDFEGKEAYPVTLVNYVQFRGTNWPGENQDDIGNDNRVIARLRNKTTLQFDLPTEAQWEYACRAGHSGDELNDGSASANNGYAALGWGQANAKGVPHPVAKLKPSDWDFYDFYGNVLEFCRDWYGAYSVDDATDPVGATSGTLRVSRGGAYTLNASACNSYYRRHSDTQNVPNAQTEINGFRVVVETDEGDAAQAAQGAQRGFGDSEVGFLETRPAATLAGWRLGSEALADSYIDTATDLAFVLVVR